MVVPLLLSRRTLPFALPMIAVFNLTTGYLLQRGWRAQRLLFAAVTVQAAIWWLLRFLQRSSTAIFIFYRFGLGIFLLSLVLP